MSLKKKKTLILFLFDYIWIFELNFNIVYFLNQPYFLYYISLIP